MPTGALYYRAQLSADITVFPDQLNGSLEDNIYENLKANVEGKVVERGCIIKILGQENMKYGSGRIDVSNSGANVIYPVSFDCILCSPDKDMEIVVKVTRTDVKDIIYAENGPIMTFIYKFSSDVDTTRFNISNGDVIEKESGRKLKVGDKVKVIIMTTQINKGDRQIITIGKLVSFASPSDVSKYKKEKRSEPKDDDIMI